MKFLGFEIIRTGKDGVIDVADEFREFYANNPTYLIDCSTVASQNYAYKKCDVVRSVLGKSASFIANLKVWALDENGRQVKSKKANEIIAKINRPNPQEDFKRWFKKLDAECKLHGKSYVRKSYSSLFNETDYYIIPNEFVRVEYDLSVDILFERKVKWYWINDGVSSYKLMPDEVHIFYDVALEVDCDKSIFGGSRLQSLSEPISTYVVLWEALTEMYGNRGALNLVSMGANNSAMLAMPALKKEKDELIKSIDGTYGLRRGQTKSRVVNTDAKVHQLTAKMSDMQFAETIKDCKKSIANAYEIPPELLGIESSRFKTIPEARKEAYTQSAIPSIEYYFSEWLQMIGETNLPFTLNADYSHLDFYQEAKLQEAVAYQQMAGAVVPLVSNNIISVDEARVKLDQE